MMGLRAKFHLVAQVDLRTVILVRCYQARFPGLSHIRVWANLGDGPPHSIMGFATSLRRQVDVRGLADEVVRRAAEAQCAQSIRPLTQEQRQETQAVRMLAAGDGFTAGFPASIPVAELLSSREAAAPPQAGPAILGGADGPAAPDGSVREAAVGAAAEPRPLSLSEIPSPSGGRGWYRDPLLTEGERFRRRYWDGTSWTEDLD